MDKSRLKSLELHGYKTFASRTQFEFPGVITAVVGPNGSGKSNIADSLRWVLGEQSYSLLRGRKTEDMIFAGSEHRPRAGMASASILFDNSDGWLPIDYSEVALTRRAYRDGQNEYLLNGQRVRLKEISELLAQSGLAERTYTIIGQGLVDAALSLKPEERRRFFEEAAGIGLYRSRREEALNRLETTRRNLERVQDILVELEPRMMSLEKQARRAMEYDRVKADLRVLLRDWYGYHWHRVQQEQTHSREVVRVQEIRQQEAREKLQEVETRLESQRLTVINLRNHLNELHGQSAVLHQKREKLNRELAVLDERKKAIQEQSQNTQADLARLEEEQASLLEQETGLTSELMRLKQELVDAHDRAAVAQKEYSARAKERERIEAGLRESRKLLVGQETRQVQLKAHRQELENRKENLERSIANFRQGLLKEVQVLTDARTHLEDAAQIRNNLEQNRRLLDDEFHKNRDEIGKHEILARQASDLKNGQNAEKARIKARLEVLEQADRTFMGLTQGARLLLQTSRQGKLKGNYRAFNSILQVPAQFEVAVAAVLGEYVDGVIIDDQDFPDDALALLEHGEKGRAVLFTGRGVPGEELDEKVDLPGIYGVASQLVNVPERLDGLVKALLGQTLIVNDRDTARAVLNKSQSISRVVTLKGEVFHRNGIVIAGQDGKNAVISRPREKKELTEALAQVEVKLAEVSDELAGLEKKISHMRDEGGALEKRQRILNQDIFQAGQRFQQASLAVEQAQQRHDWQRSQVGNLENQLHHTIEEIEQQKIELEKTDSQVQKLNEDLRHHNRALASYPLDELQAQVAHWSTGAAVADRAVKEAQRRSDEHLRVVENNRKQIAILQQRLDGFQRSGSELLSMQEALHADENQVNSEIEVLQQTIQPEESELAGIEEHYTRIQSEQSAMQQAALVADRYATQAQLELNRIRESLESLKRRIEEDFGLVAFEYTSDTTGQSPLPLDGMVEQLPMLTEIPPEIEDAINRQRAQLRRMGAINPEAQKEYLDVKERFEFMTHQTADLKKADVDLRQVIAELDELMKKAFRKTFDEVAHEFKGMFTRLFGGGTARLVLDDEDHPAEAGIDIEARLPGRREQGLSLLSGGERSLTAVALIFSLLKISPTPFCVLDEVDAMLDEANVGRFCELLKELSQKTQFIVITHNRNTVQVADVIYGVTMGQDSASQVISLRLDEVSEEMVR